MLLLYNISLRRSRKQTLLHLIHTFLNYDLFLCFTHKPFLTPDFGSDPKI